MTNPPTIVTLDHENGGLRPGDSYPWEIGAVVDKPGEPSTLHVWHVADFRPALADPKALELGGFYDRHPRHAIDPLSAELAITGPDLDVPVNHIIDVESRVAFSLERLIRGAIVVACNPTFDVPRLTSMLGRNGYAWTAHYRPICATTYAAGVVDRLRAQRGEPPMPVPWVNNDIAAELGVERANAHSALWDALFARDLRFAAMAAAESLA